MDAELQPTGDSLSESVAHLPSCFCLARERRAPGAQGTSASKSYSNILILKMCLARIVVLLLRQGHDSSMSSFNPQRGWG